MKKFVIFFILILSSISIAFAENQKYVVSNKKGKARFVEVENVDGTWQYAQSTNDLILENGFEFEGFEAESHKFSSSSSTIILFEHEGKFYKVVFPDKDIKPVDEKGEVTANLGFRNYLSNTAMGDFYKTSTPGLIALLCAFISGIFLIWGLFFEKVPVFVRWGFSIPLCAISILEIGAAASLGTDAAWWVNPDDVGYWIATPLLIPYAIVAAYMIYSYKLYGYLGKLKGAVNAFTSTLLIIGIVLTVISAIFVVINFIFALFVILFAGWMFSGVSHKDNKGNIINSGPLGTYKTDHHGNTTHIGN